MAIRVVRRISGLGPNVEDSGHSRDAESQLLFAVQR